MKLDLIEVRQNLASGINPTVERLKKRALTRSVLALTLTADHIDVARVRGPAGGDLVVTRPAGPVAIGADEILRNPEKMGAVLGAALEGAGLREKRCAVSIPPAWVLTASTDLPEVSPDDLRGYLELRAEREFSIPLSELRLGHSAYTLPDGTTRATLAALPAKRLEAVEAMLAAAGRRAASVSLALDGCFLNGETTLLHLLADGSHVDVVVTAGVVEAGQGVAALRTLPGIPGGRNGAEPAALPDLGADAALANPESGNGNHFNPAAFCREVRITLGRLPTAVQERVRAVRFAGAEAAARQLCEETRDGLRRMGIEPPDGCAVDDSLVEPINALRHLRRDPVPFEFIVAVPNKWEVWFHRLNTPRGRRVAGVIAALILLPMLAFFVQSRREASLKEEWARINGSVVELDALQKKISRFRPWYDRTPTRVQLLESLFAAFPESGEVWAKSIQIKGATVSLTGYARNQGAIDSMLKNLGKRPDVKELRRQSLRSNGNDNVIQFAVVYHWEASHDR